MGLVLRVSSDSGHRDLTSSSLDFSSQAKSSSSKRLEHGYGLIFAFSFAEVDGLPVCSAEIPAIDLSERPCYYKGAGRMKGSYIRVGDADLPMTDYELYSYEAFRKHLHDDERPIQRASLSTAQVACMDEPPWKSWDIPGLICGCLLYTSPSPRD